MASGALVDVEISVNIAYGYDIRGEVSCEEGVAGLPNRPPRSISDRHGIRQAIPEDWRERFIEAYDQEFREWIVAAGDGHRDRPQHLGRLRRDAGRRRRPARRRERRAREDHHAGQARALRNTGRCRRVRRDPTQVKDHENAPRRETDRPPAALGHGRRRPHRPGRLQAPHRRAARQHRLPAGLRRLRPRLRARQGLRPEPRRRRGPALSRLPDADRRGGEARRRGRGRHHRHPELHPLRDHQGLPRGRPARDLREAALLHRRRVRGDRRARRRRRA